MLLVDDERGLRKGLAAFLRLGGHEVVEAGSVREGLAAAEAAPPDVLISDYRMDDGTGLDLARALLRTLPETKVILLTGYAEGEALAARDGDGPADRVLEKPARPRAIREVVESLLEGAAKARPGGDVPGAGGSLPWRGTSSARERREERRLLWGEREES